MLGFASSPQPIGLVIGARYDTMDPKWLEMMSKRFARGDYLYLANGSHLAIYDDQQAYFAGLDAGSVGESIPLGRA